MAKILVLVHVGPKGRGQNFPTPPEPPGHLPRSSNYLKIVSNSVCWGTNHSNQLQCEFHRFSIVSHRFPYMAKILVFVHVWPKEFVMNISIPPENHGDF